VNPWRRQLVGFTNLVTRSDRQGRFNFSDVPAGTWNIHLVMPSNRGGRPIALPQEENAEHGYTLSPGALSQVEIRGGPASHIEVRKQGRVVVGQAKVAEELRPVHWTTANVFARPTSRTNAQFARGYARADGSFVLPFVEPGEYLLHCWLEGSPAAALSEYPYPDSSPIGSSTPLPLTITTNASSGEQPLDVSSVIVKLRKPLKIGDVPPPFTLKTADGQTLCFADCAGRPVLLVFCCTYTDSSSYSSHRGLIKGLQRLKTELGSNSPVAFIVINLYDKPEAAQAWAREAALDWPQVCAPEAFQFFTSEYECYSTPDLLLLGADGKVVGRHRHVKEIAPLIRAAASQTGKNVPANSREKQKSVH
jgi:hypothetical protein